MIPALRRSAVRGARAVPAALMILAVSIGLLPAQEEEDLGSQIREMRVAYDRARDRIDDLDFAGAIGALGVIIGPRQGARARDLDLEELELLCAAYDLRARAHFNTGGTHLAESDFSSLLQLNPSYVIDRQTLSPKVVALFDEVRSRVAGVLTLEVDPPDARILVDGVRVERDGQSIGLLAGDRELRIEKEGFDPSVERLRVLAGSTIEKSVRLRPNRRTLEFITVPVDVSISIDGKPVGVTGGSAPPEVMALAERYGFDPGRASAPLQAPLVQPGMHSVTFERECYETHTVRVQVALDLEHNAPLRFAPVIMREARTDLRVESRPPGAQVFVDGEAKGRTPVNIASVCGGERSILVDKAGVGSWRDRVRVQPGRANLLDVRLRPTLLYAGTFRLDDWGRATWSNQDRALLRELGRGLKTLNLVRDSDVLGGIRTSVIDYMILDPGKVRRGEFLSKAILEQAAERAQADLVLVGLTRANDPDKAWTLALYSVLHDQPERIHLKTDRADGVGEFVSLLDSAPAEREPSWGLRLADTLLPSALDGGPQEAAAPVVVRVSPGSPAAGAGLREGDRVRLAGERAVRSAREVMEAMAGANGGSGAPQIDLLVESGGARRTVRLTGDRSPVVLPFTDPAVLYNRALAEYRLRSRAAESEEERGVALLNTGIAYMHFRLYDEALSRGFGRASLPQGRGVSRGTVDYYRGLCSLRKGDAGWARSAVGDAAAAAGSTIGSADGPSAAAAAKRMLLALQ